MQHARIMGSAQRGEHAGGARLRQGAPLGRAWGRGGTGRVRGDYAHGLHDQRRVWRGALERSSGNVPYDFFMGTVLNPRFGLFDLKFFFESHIGMGTWGALAVILPAVELERAGSLSLPMIVVSACFHFVTRR